LKFVKWTLSSVINHRYDGISDVSIICLMVG